MAHLMRTGGEPAAQGDEGQHETLGRKMWKALSFLRYRQVTNVIVRIYFSCGE